MPIDFLILALVTAFGIILTILGTQERRLSILGLVGAVAIIVLAAELSVDRNVTVGYQSNGTAINYAMTGQEIFAIGVLGFVGMLWNAAKFGRWIS